METVIKSEHWVWYYVVSKNGVKLGPDELVVKNKQLPGIDKLPNWLNGAKKQDIELRYFIEEDEADNDLRRYKKQLSKIVEIEDQVITIDNISGFQKTVPQSLVSGENVKHPAQELGIPLVKDIKTDAPIVSVSQNNINTNKVSEVIGEELVPISYKETDTATIPSVKHQNHGGKRVGAGVKKGYQQTQEHKDKRLAKLKGNQNAAKNK